MPQPTSSLLQSAEHVTDADDRQWVEPRLAHLLGLADATFERDDLFAAWRLFFECLADDQSTVLVFEDLQWADAGLLDFIEYLVEWARSKPIFVLGLARPELAGRRPAFGTATRGGFTGLALEPLSDAAMDALLQGLVPGLPEELKTSISTRAEGIPLYAVETVRMLLNRGQLELAEGAYRVVGEIGALAVPETLHALVASRIDGLEAGERRLVQDASVLGKTFVLEALASVSGQSTDKIEPTLQALTRKEILFLEADPRSAERGQYGFLQDLVRRVAYETLARRDRKARHLAAGEFFETSWGGREQEVVEVVASHYLTALDLEPDAEDAQTLRTKVRETLSRAGERAASLGATAEAAASFGRAAELAEGPLDQARLLRKAGNAHRAFGDTAVATDQFVTAIALFEEAGDAHAAARTSADLAGVEFSTGRLADAIERMERAYGVLEGEEPDEDLAFFLSQLARAHYFAGNHDLSEQRNERALAVAERLRLLEVLSHALNNAGLLAMHKGRWETARALTSRALEISLENDFPFAATRGYTNLSVILTRLGSIAEAGDLTLKALELARRIGNRSSEWFSLGNLVDVYDLTGRWDEAIEIGEEVPPGMETQALGLSATLAEIARHRGDPASALKALENVSVLESSTSIQDRSVYASTRWSALMAERRYEEALELATRSAAALAGDPATEWLQFAIAEAALALGLHERAAEAVALAETLAPGDTGPLIQAQTHRYRALVAASQDDNSRVEPGFKSAAATFREYGLPFAFACTQLEQAEWLAMQGRAEEAAPLVTESREIFERLRAAPWLQRADALAARSAVVAVS